MFGHFETLNLMMKVLTEADMMCIEPEAYDMLLIELIIIFAVDCRQSTS